MTSVAWRSGSSLPCLEAPHAFDRLDRSVKRRIRQPAVVRVDRLKTVEDIDSAAPGQHPRKGAFAALARSMLGSEHPENMFALELDHVLLAQHRRWIA